MVVTNTADFGRRDLSRTPFGSFPSADRGHSVGNRYTRCLQDGQTSVSSGDSRGFV